MEFVGDQRVVRAQQTKRDGWAARVDGERVARIFCAHGGEIGLKVPQGELRQGLSVRPKETADATLPFTGLGGLRGGQDVAPRAGVRVDHTQRRLLALQVSKRKG